VEGFRTLVVEQVLAETNRQTKVIVPGEWRPLLPKIHGECTSLTNACEQLSGVGSDKRGRLAALTGLEPEALRLLQDLFDGNADADVIEKTLVNAVDPGVAIVEMNAETVSGDDPRDKMEARNEMQWSIWRALPKAQRALELANSKHIERLRYDPDVLVRQALFVVRHALARGTPEEALSLAHRAVELTAQVKGDTSSEHVEALAFLAEVLMKLGQLSASDTILHEAYAITEIHRPTGAHLLVHLFDTWADVLSRLGRYDEAEEKAERALEIAKTISVRAPLREAKARLKKIRALRQRSSE
jgi:tetratricopeptide (TPR) repeat protein